MTQLGFSYYDEVVNTAPTTQEILAALTNDQKVAVLNGFANKIPVIELKHSSGVPSFAVIHLYRKIDEIEEKARALMRGEVIVTPAVFDEEGNEVAPVVYNTLPSTSTALKNLIKADFAEDFTEAQVTAILVKMLQYSKRDGSGDWAYYSSQVIL